MISVYTEQNGVLFSQASLLAALRLPEYSPMVISFVGAGGKTTTMYGLADELTAIGKSVIVTTSTHIGVPKDRRVLVADHALEAEGAVCAGQVLVIGRRSGTDKLQGLPHEELERLSCLADVLLIEADGAKGLPLKVPGKNEPVIANQTHVVIACAGLNSIGRSFGEACFRYEKEGAWLQQLYGGPSARIRPEVLACILTDARGAKKDVGNREYRIILNKADDEPLKQEALAVILLIGNIKKEHCVITSFA